MMMIMIHRLDSEHSVIFNPIIATLARCFNFRENVEIALNVLNSCI